MERTTFIRPNQGARLDLIQHITSINKYLTKEYLEGLTNIELLCEAHPAYREDYKKALEVKEVPVGSRILKMEI